MPAYILVRAIDGFDPDDPMTYQTGYPVNVRSFSRLGGNQVPPKFVQVCITDVDDADAIESAYCREWRREIDWEFIGHDYAVDGHRLRVWMKPELVSASGLNNITRDQVETFLNRWNATVYSTLVGEVIFDCAVYSAICSSGFWGHSVIGVDFTEKSYDQGTGVHTVEANYRQAFVDAPDPRRLVESAVIERGGIIVAHPTNKITFEVNRSSVFDQFKADVKEAISVGAFSRRVFKLLPQHVQMALDNGGALSVTQQQFAQYIYNRLND